MLVQRLGHQPTIRYITLEWRRLRIREEIHLVEGKYQGAPYTSIYTSCPSEMLYQFNNVLVHNLVYSHKVRQAFQIPELGHCFPSLDLGEILLTFGLWCLQLMLPCAQSHDLHSNNCFCFEGL